ncbi:MAG: flagellar FliJ family protein [Clostridia bacterium]
MKAFKFSLQSVLNNANNQKDECILRLKEVMAQIRKNEDEKNAHSEMIRACESSLDSHCDAIGFRQIKIYIEDLSEKIESINKELERLNILRSQRLEDLKKAKIKCSTFEKIREKKYTQYLDDIKKFEEKEIEELVNNNYFTKAE